jgi:hypothetical protein
MRTERVGQESAWAWSSSARTLGLALPETLLVRADDLFD